MHRTAERIAKAIGQGNLTAAVVVIMALAIVKLVTSTLTQNVPITVRGDLQAVQALSLSYGEPQYTGISPVCGCMADLAAEEWRGITMVAKNLTIRRPPSSSKGAYFFTGAVPGHISWRPKGFGFKYRVFEIRLESAFVFNPDTLLSGIYPKGWQVSEVPTEGPVQWLQLLTDKTLSIASLGEKPISAWIPKMNSDVSVKYLRGMHVKSATLAQLQETGQSCSGGADAPMEYPLLDSLGPNLVYWVEDPAAWLLSDRRPVVQPSAEPHQPNRIVAILIQSPPFATRVAVQDMSPALSKMIVQNPSGPFSWTWQDHCQHSRDALLEVQNPGKQGEEYTKVRANILKKDSNVLTEIPAHFSTSDGRRF